MAKKISFKEFKAAVDNRTIPFESLSDYVEFDDESAIPRLQFRQDALIDTAPDTFDVDEEIYRLQRSLDDQEDTITEVFSFAPRQRIVAEGDSWYNLPKFAFRPPAIADWIKKNKRFKLKNIARWGHTLDQILSQNEYLEAIDKYQADFFMLCGGGNDLQEGLASGKYIYSYDETRDINNYLTKEGEKGLANIGNGLREIMSTVSSSYPSLPILIHGYDYPRPLVDGGKYIGKHLKKMGFPNEKMQPVINSVLNQLNDHVKAAAKAHESARFIDCRELTKEFTWYDDMHPSKDGFLALSLRFEEEMISINNV